MTKIGGVIRRAKGMEGWNDVDWGSMEVTSRCSGWSEGEGWAGDESGTGAVGQGERERSFRISLGAADCESSGNGQDTTSLSRRAPGGLSNPAYGLAGKE